MIRLLIVDDSRVVREVIKDLLEKSNIEVIGEAANGQEAIDKTRELKPDIVTMDIMMPVMDGLTAVEQIMAFTPVPILVFASSINSKDVNIAFEAIHMGALDVMEKPDNLSREGFEKLRDILIKKIRILSNIRVIKHLRGRRKTPKAPRIPPRRDKTPKIPESLVIKPPPKSRFRAGRVPTASILAMGASTGGPKAVMNVLQELPEDFSLGGVLVQHIGASFTPGFADWLDKECSIKIKIAEDGEPIEAGTMLVGPGDIHLEVDGDKVVLTDNPPVNNCRPSVDVLFQSVAKNYGDKAMAILLTGMGKDGASGIVGIKKNNGITIVQDEESSVIFGMPRIAIETGAVDTVLSLSDISAEILKIAGGKDGQNTSGRR